MKLNPNSELRKARARLPSAGARRLRRFTDRMVLGVRESATWGTLKRPEGRAPFAPLVSTSAFGLNPTRHDSPNSPAAHRHADDSRAHFWWRCAGLCAKRGRWSLGVVQTLALVSLGSALSVSAAEPKTADAPWVSLFNGRDLSGWKIVALTNPAPAVVEGGAMVLRQRSNTIEHTFVTSEREYEDFILELDLKDDPGFNSGILLRCAAAPADAKVRLNGYQVKIDNTPRAWTGGIFDDFGDSWKWLHDLADNERGRTAFKLGEWAHFRIECIGPTIKVWVNGVPTCHLVDEKYRKGGIAFKIHSIGNSPKAGQDAIRLKNIRIITEHPERYALPMELPPRSAPVEPGKFDKAKPRPDGSGRTP